jgi:hypothetical protein
VLFVATLGLLLLSNTLLAGVFLGGGVFISFVCPYWLMSVQKYKKCVAVSLSLAARAGSRAAPVALVRVVLPHQCASAAGCA